MSAQDLNAQFDELMKQERTSYLTAKGSFTFCAKHYDGRFDNLSHNFVRTWKHKNSPYNLCEVCERQWIDAVNEAIK